MGRAKRIEQEGAIYHVISKAVNEENTFKNDEDYKYFLELTCNILTKFDDYKKEVKEYNSEREVKKYFLKSILNTAIW